MTHKNIKQLHEEDQKQRGEASKGYANDWEKIEPMFKTFADDQKRLVSAKYLLQTGKLKTDEDFLYAAFIFLHSEFIPEYLALAVMCSKISMDMGNKRGKWLYARALDRFYSTINIPQIYGTHEGVISKKTTDKERAEYDVKPLKELLLNPKRTLEK